ncbi:MAG: Pvc16 family protein [Acidimicrobiia bacterium]
MIDEVDAALGALLAAVADTKATVSFDPPGDGTSSRKPTYHLLLRGIEEAVEARKAAWEDVRTADGRVEGRQPPLRTYRLTYALAATAGSTTDEHRMLGTALRGLSAHDAVPAEHLSGTLAGEVPPVLVEVALPSTTSGALASAEWWSALGIPPRAALEVVVHAPLVPELRTDLAPPADELHLEVTTRSGPGTTDVADLLSGRIVRRWRTTQVDEPSG